MAKTMPDDQTAHKLSQDRLEFGLSDLTIEKSIDDVKGIDSSGLKVQQDKGEVL